MTPPCCHLADSAPPIRPGQSLQWRFPSPFDGGEGERKLLQPVADLSEARLRASFILVATGRSADADAGDRFIASLDRQAADRSYELRIKDGGIEASPGNALGKIRRRNSQLGGCVGLTTCHLSAQCAGTVAD